MSLDVVKLRYCNTPNLLPINSVVGTCPLSQKLCLITQHPYLLFFVAACSLLFPMSFLSLPSWFQLSLILFCHTILITICLISCMSFESKCPFWINNAPWKHFKNTSFKQFVLYIISLLYFIWMYLGKQNYVILQICNKCKVKLERPLNFYK